jgi:hypothetical protein
VELEEEEEEDEGEMKKGTSRRRRREEEDEGEKKGRSKGRRDCLGCEGGRTGEGGRSKWRRDWRVLVSHKAVRVGCSCVGEAWTLI